MNSKRSLSEAAVQDQKAGAVGHPDPILSLALQPGGTLSLDRLRTATHPSIEGPHLEEDLEKTFSRDPAAFLLRLGLVPPEYPLHPTLRFFRAFAAEFPRKMMLHPKVESLRGRCYIPPESDAFGSLLNEAPPMAGSEYLDVAVFTRLWDDLHRVFRDGIAEFPGSAEEWFNTFADLTKGIGRIHFHLVENRHAKTPFAFLATYGTHLGSKGRIRHVPLRNALEEFRGQPRQELSVLKPIYRAAKDSTWLKKSIESGEIFHPLAWTPAQAHRFLQDVEKIQSAGILCRIPDWWKSAQAKTGFRLQVGENPGGGLGMEALVDFRPELILAGEAISENELRALVESGEALANLKGKWVAIDPGKIREALDLFSRAKKISKGMRISLSEAFKLLSGEGGKALPELDLAAADIAPGAWLREVLEKMRNPALVRGVRTEGGFRGTLRPYQQLGLNWLHFLHQLGFGACLADDMGLGKTVQILALLNVLKARNPMEGLQTLLVAPASLIFNWQNEFERFTPGLKVRIAHGTLGEKLDRAPRSRADSPQFDVVLTTYAMVDRSPWMAKHEWSIVILDEAQAIKNPGARQSRAVKGLRAQRRLALTGTPIENRLSDLWSLFDFLNPGLLGGPEEFLKFTRRLQDRPEGYGRLRKVVQPYILRRLKSDKSLLPDLPDKVEMKSYAGLRKKQVALYRELVRKLERSLADAEGIRRRGLILAFLIKFKQVCNHPDHYVGSGAYAEKDSGKFLLLRELCEPILEKRERLLLFTQFAEITEPLAEFLEGVFGRPGLVLTGSTPVAKRRALVEEFQGDAYIPFLVLSLKAGGTGLNLTRANHVIHFDRWWNPAVENQATDRAFRLGQAKNVLVHKLITRGTLEEKIDRLIESKSALARDIIQAGNEDWVTEMNDKELLDLFTLNTLEDGPNGLV
jgi:non-specific serine/threonine protein kinase